MINIVYTSDDNFVPQIGAAVASVLENNKNNDVHIFIMSKGITDEHKTSLTEFVSSYNQGISIIEIPDISELTGCKIDTGGWNDIVLSRLFLDKLLPQDIDKVLYLDGDTIVRQDLRYLYNMDIKHHVLAAAVEPVVPRRRKKAIGLKGRDPYYNAGVLLINLKLWKDRDTGKRVMDFFAAHNYSLFANDQDAINGCLKDEIFPISFTYNFANTNIFYPFSAIMRWLPEGNRISKEHFKEIVKDPAIVHYLGEERPWRHGSHHRFGADFFKYYKMTPIGKDKEQRKQIIEQGWEKYFFCFYTFNFFMKPFPDIRRAIINSLIPAFMKYRKKQREKEA
jgi:Lipopolysaccharide biosynthesis proteins, LPS:glycosyltransferases